MKKRSFASIILALVLLPALCLTVYADGDKLPNGFVQIEKFLSSEDGGTQTLDYNKVDGYYLVLDYVSNDGFGMYGDDGIYGKEPELSPYQTVHQTLSSKPSVTVYRDKTTAKGFTVTGTYDWKHTYVGGEGSVHKAGENEVCRCNISLSISNITLDEYNYVCADMKGSLHAEGGSNDSYDEVYDITLNATKLKGSYKYLNENGVMTYYIMFCAGEDGPGNRSYRDGVMWFRIAGVLPKGGKIPAGITQNAKETSGEDGGVSVPGAIVISVLGGGAAVAGAAAAATGASGGSDDIKKKRKEYKMYVQKDFGDAIRRGGDKPVIIRARMAEVDESGVEHDRNDLTGKIGVSADGMTVHGAALAGRYCEATVSVPGNNQNDTANITFTFTGEGGSFTNTVIFRLIDGPALKFVEETEEAGTFNLYGEGTTIDAIPGDGFTYTRKFMIVDAPVAPKLSDITAVNTGNYDVEFALTDREAVYNMTVKNNTKPDPEHDIFAKLDREEFEIHVVVEGEKEPVKGYVTVELYPEGITVSSTEEGKKNNVKYVRVQAYEKENVGDLDKKWQVSQIKFTLAVLGKDKAIIDPEEAKYRFEKLKGSGGLGMRADKEEILAEKYEYKESWGDWNGKFTYDFEPNADLPEPEDGTFYMVVLPAFCEYDGKTYEAEIPLRLRGKDPDPMGEWEKEYKELQRRILQYSLPENINRWIAQLKECATEPRASVEEMRLVGKWILREYMDYWTTQQSRDQTEATMYNVIVNVLEWTKFAGDCAFSFLINAYAGPVADALISPAKDFITGAIGEIIAARSHGDEVNVDNFEFSKNLAAAGDNLVSNSIDLKDWKKAAATLGGYFCYCAVKNYLLKLREKGESDFWGSLCDAFKDMTAAALKSKAGDLIGKWLKESKKFQEKIGPFIAKYFKETNFETLQKKLNDSLGFEGDLRKMAGYANDKIFEAKVADVVEKYISGLVGAGFDKVREVYDGSKFVIEGGYVYYCFNIDLFDAFHYGIKLNLTRTLQAMSGDFFGWFYDFFFAGVPAAGSVIQKPKDPPLLASKN